MKNMVLQFQYSAILLSLTIAFSSCSQLPEYKVTEDGEGIYIVELSERPDVETLNTISDEIKSDMGKKYCTLVFTIPSEYPNYPKEPWATVSYSFDRSYQDNSIKDHMIMKIMGARSEKDKEALINIIPKDAKPLKVWYHNHPALEGLVVMDAYEFMFFQLPDLVVAEGLDYEIPNETIQADQYIHPDFTESYKRNEALTEFSDDDGQLIYYVDEKGRLIHVRGDGSEHIMDPVNIER